MSYEKRISYWSTDGCSSDLRVVPRRGIAAGSHFTALEPRPCPDVHRFVGTVSDAQVVILVGADGDRITGGPGLDQLDLDRGPRAAAQYQPRRHHEQDRCQLAHVRPHPLHHPGCSIRPPRHAGNAHARALVGRSEEHTSELQSLMRTSYAVFCLKKKNTTTTI